METHLSIMSKWIDRVFERDFFFTYSLVMPMLSIYHAGEHVSQPFNQRERERERKADIGTD